MSANKIRKLFSLFLAVSLMGTLLSTKIVGAAEATVTAGTTSNFAILAGETITNTGTTEITGDIGLHPGTAFTGQDDIVLTGELHLSDAVALTAKNDLVTAFNDAAGRTPQIISRELGGQTLKPGVYTSNEKDFLLNGELILDGEGDPEAIFIFQTDSTLITGSASSVVLTNAATPCGLFWKIGSSATLGSNSKFAGRILALTSITLETGAEIRGQLLARNGSVTLDSNKIISGKCDAVETETATLYVIKQVENEEGETAAAGDFSIHVTKDGLDVEGSPSVGMEAPGRAYTLEAGTYKVKEANSEGYIAAYSGDTTDGTITLAPGDNKTIIITNRKIYGNIAVEKYDDEGNRLSDAEFTLFRNDVQVGDARLTDENGSILFSGLEKGTYAVKETRAPEGYVTSDNLYEAEIIENNETVVVSVTNYRIRGQILVNSVDNNTGETLPGAEFTLFKDDIQVGKPEMTDDNGSVVFSGLTQGTYTIKETKAPEGYVPGGTIDVEISGEETVVVDSKHSIIMGQIGIVKVDAMTGEGLEGAEFVISDEAGHLIFRGKTDVKGLLVASVSYGKYVIEEVAAPLNYVKTDKKYPVDVTDQGQKFNLEVKNSKSPDKTAVLPKAGDHTNTTFFFMGLLAIAGGAMLLKKRRIA